jgi:hypothetical protein
MLFVKREEPQLTHLEEALNESIAAKLSQPLFQADMRFSVYSEDRADMLVTDFAASLETLSSPGFQSFKFARHLLRKQYQYNAMLFQPSSRHSLAVQTVSTQRIRTGIHLSFPTRHHPHGRYGAYAQQSTARTREPTR